MAKGKAKKSDAKNATGKRKGKAEPTEAPADATDQETKPARARRQQEILTHEEQLALWVAGDSQHFRGEGVEQCVPDFSCCRPALKQPEEVRRAFAAGGERTREGFLGTFLNALIADAIAAGELSGKVKVHIAGREEQ